MKHIILCIILIYVLLLIKDNRENLIHFIISILFDRSIKSIPLNKKLLKIVREDIIYKIKDYRDYTFIDFGSGYGNIIDEFKYDFHKLIGIELETSSHKEAIQKLNHYNHIILLNQNMETYQFPNENIILYMYESLFSIRDIIYNHVMKNLQKVNKKVYIIYISENQIQNIWSNCELNIDNFILKDIKYGNLIPFERTIKIYESL